MKKLSLLAGFLATSMYYAQIKFEEGYFIDNSGAKKEVLIRNVDWKNNPVDIEYKTDNASKVQKETISNIQEFSINGGRKFIRAKVMLDRSSGNLNSMSYTHEPDFKEETIFLKYVVEGKAGLFYYEDGNLRRYFYSSESSEPKQLIYKPYYIDQASIAYNEDYKKQIAEQLKCGITAEQIKRLDYTTKDLTKTFIQYNECSGNQIINYEKKDEKAKSLIHLNIRAGINTSELNVYEPSNITPSYHFGNKNSFRIGLELEYVLPFNKNKWAVFIEPTYQYYKNSTEVVTLPGSLFETRYTATADYKSIEVPFGVRHYFFLSDKSKIFLNAAYVLDFALNSTVTIERSKMDIESGGNMIFGAGFKYDKFSAEVRVGTYRGLFRNYMYVDGDYRAASFILGYTLF
ncbi:hypothetical protein SAMN05421786_10553 [Chryseobacterium ureilyticum]|uniref:Outer membrane protein beta-barrel domain-containing protein n=1 Tax=Chryseobacterium ureilyticum TaxID=373668 RepID=A0A1N7PCC7_9FLAO|nr:hypothetical protein [Chryseobacterium ureilyticum]SIT08285.1 hypothetical protein SAMN05421786_10553 [Chryseobacterium ureilyticum]